MVAVVGDLQCSVQQRLSTFVECRITAAVFSTQTHTLSVPALMASCNTLRCYLSRISLSRVCICSGQCTMLPHCDNCSLGC